MTPQQGDFIFQGPLNESVCLSLFSLLHYCFVEFGTVGKIAGQGQLAAIRFQDGVVITLRLGRHVLIQCMLFPQPRIAHISGKAVNDIHRPFV